MNLRRTLSDLARVVADEAERSQNSGIRSWVALRRNDGAGHQRRVARFE